MDRRSAEALKLEPPAERRAGEDRRAPARRRTVLGARLLHDADGRRSQDIRLRDISPEGARAVLSQPDPIPKAGFLIVPVTGEGHAYRVIWSSAGQAGLAFEESWDLRASDLPPQARGLKRLWLELAAR